MFDKIKNNIIKIKQEKPLILCLTNYVTMDFVANGLLSLGASPVMSHSRQEIEDLLQLAHALVINLGTLDEKFIDLCEHACHLANQLNIPIILDPVGSGASRYRTDTSLHIINNYHIDIIRGNASEIMSLSDFSVITKGVDSTSQSRVAIESAKKVSKQYDVAIIISGQTDIILDHESMVQFSYGSFWMPQITGSGCLLTAVVGAFYTIEKNRFDASALATVFYGVCGEKAAKKAEGPASFKINFLDELNLIPEEDEYESS